MRLNPIIIKLAVVALVVKEIWLLMQVPSIADAAISFFTVGQIPGTDHTLSPNEMLLLVGGVFILGFSLTFRKEIGMALSGLSRKRQSRPLRNPLQRPHPIILGAAPQPVRVISSRKAMLKSYWGTVRQKMIARSGRTARRLRSLGSLIASATWSASRFAVAKLAKIALVTYVIASELAVRFWRWFKPYAERVDRWLEKKLHQNEKTATLLSVGSDMMNAMGKRVGTAQTAKQPASGDPHE